MPDDETGGGHNVKAFGALTAVNAHVHEHGQIQMVNVDKIIYEYGPKANVDKIIKESAVKGVRTPRNYIGIH